ncbi:hypothetical protein ACQ856_11795 [Mycolicibacterium psychrotolerans]|uniref:hypothetical protein n=1 Tax=Mycolicibacterium psychrotolerans TaxID=216929 RepID=UPI003D6699F4
MSGLDAKYAFRDELSERLVADLVGPTGGDEEIIDDAPITRYVSGILYPAGGGWNGVGNAAADQDVDVGDDYDEAVTPDPAVAMANVKNPASMGLTFAVRAGGCTQIKVSIRAARYVPLPLEPSRDTPRWKRVPLRIDPVAIDVSAAQPGHRTDLSDDLTLFTRIRKADGSGAVAITLVLINERRPADPFADRDADALFQPKLTVEAVDGIGPIFVDRTTAALGLDDDDVRSNDLLFSHAPNLAVGHGCSVTWDTDHPDSVNRLQTAFTPYYDLLLADSNPDIDLPALDMRTLTLSSRQQTVRELRQLVAGYRQWITAKQSQVPALTLSRQDTARRHLQECETAADRMQDGIELLADRDDAFEAFRLMNQAMIEQRVRTERILKGKPDLHADDIPARWRPFQLGFILLCLKGIADDDSGDRKIADLLWFPTGGGKTEAYLGLIAFTIFLRRLTGRGGGVTALMRYTLRLLTIQQFERATLLICCCEAIRRERKDLGSEEISIGLYVGRAATPLTRKEAETAIKKLRNKPTAVPKEGNPMQFRSCPWCGTKLDAHKYWVGSAPPRMNINCENNDCTFVKHLPAYLVDEDIYDFHPSLIIGTVDKFAGLPWRPQANSLFNRDRKNAAGIDLIIQDELHLISGPLGTLTGLYETVVDHLAGREGIKPKVIASTATIRRAHEQTMALFDRPVKQFPPPESIPETPISPLKPARRVREPAAISGCCLPGRARPHCWCGSMRPCSSSPRISTANPKTVTPIGRSSATSTACGCSRVRGCRSKTTSRSASGCWRQRVRRASSTTRSS